MFGADALRSPACYEMNFSRRDQKFEKFEIIKIYKNSDPNFYSLYRFLGWSWLTSPGGGWCGDCRQKYSPFSEVARAACGSRMYTAPTTSCLKGVKWSRNWE